MASVELIHESRVRSRRLGWHRHHKPSNKDFPVTPRLVRAAPTAPPTTKKTWAQSAVRTALNQANLGSCTGNATTRACRLMPNRLVPKTYNEQLAVTVYKVATKDDNVPGQYPPDDTGSTTVGALTAAKELGLVTEYRWAFSFLEALWTIHDVGPVITGVDWWSGFDSPKANGELVRSGAVRGGHELCLYAVVPDASWGGGGYVEGWNSWGLWGPLGGRFRWAWSTWQRLLADGGEVGVGLRPAA